MNPIEELPFLGKTREEAEQILREKGHTHIEFVEAGESITLQTRNWPVVFLTKDDKVKKIW